MSATTSTSEATRTLREPFVAVRLTANRGLTPLADYAQPWEKGRVPLQTWEPHIKTLPPVDVEKWTLRPDPVSGLVYVTPTELVLADFSLTVRRTVRADGSIAISGASALLSVSVQQGGAVEQIAVQRNHWDQALLASRLFPVPRSDVAVPPWKYLAEPRRGLSVSLELPAGVAAAEPLVTTSSVAGVATIAVELTEAGALAWKAALEQGAASTLPGVVHAVTGAPTVRDAALQMQRRPLDTALGQLLAGRGAADVRCVDPQQSVQGRLIVVTSEFVDTTTVSITPSQGPSSPGLAPTSQVLGPAGGTVEVAVTTQDTGSVSMAWQTQVAFTPLGWAPVPASGTLSAANGWTELVKPESWFASYLVMVIPVDGAGQAQQLPAGPTSALQGVLNFTAPYVAGGLLGTTFQTDYLDPVSVALPRYPGQPFGDLVLTMFVTRDGRGGTASRRLSVDERNVVVLVGPDATVQIRTESDALPEVSAASQALGVLAAADDPR